MKPALTAFFALSLIFATVSGAQQSTRTAEDSTHLSGSQLKTLTREAHTTAQYEALANYYRKQQKDLWARAAEEKQEWARRSTQVMVSAAKYPRPVDSVHYLYDYDVYMAVEAEQLAAKYTHLAHRENGANVK
ncbi:MAG TPA: hypothetical protein VGG56_03640 [Terracidiphilus sp.]|jgi:hypothetical protein